MKQKPEELIVRVKGYSLPYSSEQVGNLRLLEFQDRVRHAKERLVLLNAPTGSGKTLAYLLHGIENFSSTIILYPTKELMEDQARNIVNLLNKLGRKVIKVDVDEKEGDIKTEHNTDRDHDVVLLVVNGDTLRYWADKEESSEGKAFLSKLEAVSSCKHLIILTNIDILYLLLRYSFFSSQKILSMIATRGKALLVVDEFHLYFGFSLLVLVNLIKLLIHATSNSFIQRVIFSSATDIDLSSVFNEKIEVIEAKYYSNDYNEREARVSRYDTVLKIRPIDYIVYDESDIDKVLSEVIELYNKITSRKENLSEGVINVLTILNSIVSCEMLYRKLLSSIKNIKIGRISSYVPRRERQSLAASNTKILVGTSAIEVGIDFDTYSLVFEASDAYSFIQRFGRVSRKRNGEAVVFVPRYSFSRLKEKLSENSEIPYSEFVKIIKESMFKLKNYEEFSNSPYALMAVAGIFAAIEKRISEERGLYLDESDLYELVFSNKYLEVYKRVFSEEIINEVLSTDKKDIDLDRFFIFSVNNVSARGNLASIPCYLKEFDTFALVSIMDLVKFNFDLMDKNSLPKEIREKIPHSYAFENSDQIAIVREISLKRNKIKLNLRGLKYCKVLLGKTIVENVTNVVTTLDQEYIEELKKVIRSTYGLLGSEDDWRLTHLKVEVNSHSYVLYLGADAFLYYYLKNKCSQKT